MGLLGSSPRLPTIQFASLAQWIRAGGFYPLGQRFESSKTLQIKLPSTRVVSPAFQAVQGRVRFPLDAPRVRTNPWRKTGPQQPRCRRTSSGRNSESVSYIRSQGWEERMTVLRFKAVTNKWVVPSRAQTGLEILGVGDEPAMVRFLHYPPTDS